ncbi:hypothetical protein BHE74_00009732 [Ensete ventricosum]|nr:hypothetical protein BHE74_00009732 [Ensete ventricosum]RZR84906.1 hypothetical protein BHM03_00011790 [Ensete ventricosum]
MRRRLASWENDTSFPCEETWRRLVASFPCGEMPISMVPPGSGQSAYRYPVGPVFHTDLYRPYWTVRIGPLDYRYADCPLPVGTAKIDHQRLISAIDGRLREKSTRSIEGEKGKKKKRKRRKKKNTSRRPHPHVVTARGRFFSRAGRKIEATLPRRHLFNIF